VCVNFLLRYLTVDLAVVIV